jgi:predicted ATPase
VAGGVRSLLNKSLLQVGGENDESRRFVMLEAIREFALEQLQPSDREASLRERHLDYFLAVAEGLAAHSGVVLQGSA